ncbi:hypothetical protein QLG02_04700 [Aeromonas sp. V90_14]|uniref:hypothetical protein n=1 Tax=Aeromonas sp. V90_14 TaxID=3044241 RepID=UPI00249F6370|nr:hypothetical protein [Aeromonas sp. V90_14]MDI3429627.1 hypothetical protein [Aeromonas sp. V90_14]
MISEATFSKKYTSFWNETLPNSKNYVRLINSGLLQAIYEPFSPADRKNNTALVNVLFFNIFRHANENKLRFENYNRPSFFESNEFIQMQNKSIEYLSRFSYGNECALPLSDIEKRQTLQLFRMIYSRYMDRHKRFIDDDFTLIIDPVFDGCGFINESVGDFLFGDTLVEIKSGERSFSSIDVRQVLTYLTLNHFSKKPYKINKIELFNPRMGISFSESVESFCKNLSALSSQELFSEIEKFIVENNFIEVYGT